MEQNELKSLLQQVADGQISVDDAILQVRAAPFTDIGFAKIDCHRGIRQGISEVIYGAGKTPEQIAAIAGKMREAGQHTVLITRLSTQAAEFLQEKFPLAYHAQARLGIIGEIPEPQGRASIVVAAAGTSDLPVAEEAALTAEALGSRVVRLYDVGVAGLHRLLAHTDELMRARVVISVAGMEGALASVIGGLVSCPVIAVPTSVGYGASFGGLSALLSMLNSCASGVSVVNIDNGFGAGYLAHMINQIGGEA